jgi:hypothetical protein
VTDRCRPVVWVHVDSLSPDDPALAANPGAPAIFVFDDVVLEGYEVSLKRIQFLYECLLEMPVVIRRGGVAGEVVAFAREHGAGRVVSTWTPSPRFSHLRDLIQRTLPVEIVEPTPFAVLEREPNLRRFAGYWDLAQKDAFRPSHLPRVETPKLPGFS